jgi:CheY-like chemotaxis protein
MADTIENLIMLQPPTADRPLLGTIVLVVEDSRHACEALRLICQRSGARIRRAESLASAERHLRTYRPRLAVVDLGLPDGSGLELIDQLSRAEPRIDGIIATSGDDSLHEAAINAGADIFLPKPISSVSHFQDVALGLLPQDMRPSRIARPSVDMVEPDPIALKDDLSLAVDLLCTDPNERTLEYVAGFLDGLAKNSGDKALCEFGAAIRQSGTAGASQVASQIRSRAEQLEAV